jgi:hypothetical protein
MILVTDKTLSSWGKTCPNATLSMTNLMCTGWNRTKASMAKGWQLTTSAMVHPHEWHSSKLYKTAILNSKRTQFVSIKKTYQLMLFRGKKWHLLQE